MKPAGIMSRLARTRNRTGPVSGKGLIGREDAEVQLDQRKPRRPNILTRATLKGYLVLHQDLANLGILLAICMGFIVFCCSSRSSRSSSNGMQLNESFEDHISIFKKNTSIVKDLINFKVDYFGSQT